MNDLIHYGEAWRRLVAALLDAAILAPPIAAAWWLTPAGPAESTATAIVFGSGLVMFYRMVLEASARQATPGKRLLDLKVTNPEGARLSYASTAVRGWPFWLPGAMFGVSGEIIAVVLVVCAAAVAVIPLTPRRQGLHDLTARTIVVRSDVEIAPANAG